MVISLTGFMGSGKSSVGAELARLLGYRFCDLDSYIVHKAGKDIPAIFAESEERFRALEAEAVRDVVIMSRIEGFDLVLALGGGTLMNPEIQKLVSAQTKCIYLETGLETLEKRLSESVGRPVLGTDSLENLLESRQKGYESAALKINTGDKTPEQIAGEILKLI